jgi:leucyl-tRNA synthetase
MDDWLANKMSMHLTNYISAMQDYDIKKASDIAFFILPNDVEWYLRRHGCSKKLLLKVSKLMLQLWSPVTPHIAEELWMSVPGCKGMVTASLLPAPDKVPELFEKYDPEVYLKSVVDDISNIIRVARLKPTNIFVYTCSSWKTEIVKDSLKLDIKNVMPVLMHKEYNVPKDVQAKFLKSVYKRMTEYKSLPAAVFSLNETKLLLNATVFLKDRFEVHVHILNEDNAQDRHKHKAFVSAPFRPGIVIEC